MGDDGTVVRYNGVTWNQLDTGTGVDFSDILVFSSDDIFVSSDEGIFHFDGNNWMAMDTGDAAWFNCLWGSSRNDIYPASRDTFDLWHNDGGAWSPVGLPESLGEYNYLDIWGSSPDDIYAIGDNIVHYDGNHWTVMDIGKPGDYGLITGIWGNTADEVFEVSSTGIVYRYEGISWNRMHETGITLLDIWGDPSTGLFVLGEENGKTRLLHYRE